MNPNTDNPPRASTAKPLPDARTPYEQELEAKLETLMQRFTLLEITMAEEHASRQAEAPIPGASSMPPVGVEPTTNVGTSPALPPMSERPILSAPVPIINPKEPFAMLQELDTWHGQVTNAIYKNALGTHLAITTLLREATNASLCESGSANLRQFRRVVMQNLLVKHQPTISRDDVLWKAFKYHFRHCLEITTDREEKVLFSQIHNSQRKAGAQVYGFASDFDTSIQQYNSICWCPLSPAQAAHQLIRALNLEHTPMLDLKLRLDVAKENGANIDALMETIANFPNIVLLTQLERTMFMPQVQRTMTVCDEEVTTNTHVRQAVEKPTTATSSICSPTYDHEAVLCTYKIGKKANQFPANLGEDPLHEPEAVRSRSAYRNDFAARDRVVRNKLKELTNSRCSRCFREICAGTSGGRFACAIKGQPLYIPNTWSHVLKSILMWLTLEKTQYGKAVESFYASGGTNFGSIDALVQSQLIDKANDASYVSSSPRHTCLKPSRTYTRAASIKQPPRPHRHPWLCSLLDLGNPTMLAGLCWWELYGPMLKCAGMLDCVKKASCDTKMSFGDAPGQLPLFVLIQVPLWYQCWDGSTMLVFANIRIVPNSVGLLDGKQNMMALGMNCRLRGPRTSFKIQGKKLHHLDDGDYFSIMLGKPRPFLPEERGIAVYRDQATDVLRPHAVLARDHVRTTVPASLGFQLYDHTTFPELNQGAASSKSAFKSLTRTSGWTKLVRKHSLDRATAAYTDTSDKAPRFVSPNAKTAAPLSSSSVISTGFGPSCTVTQDPPEPSSTTSIRAATQGSNPDSTPPVALSSGQVPQLGSLPQAYQDEVPVADCAEVTGQHDQNDNDLDTDFEDHSDRQLTLADVTEENVRRLHCRTGHPSPSQLLKTLRNANAYPSAVLQRLETVVRGLQCAVCARNARRRTPSRPTVSVPKLTAPGQDLHVDVGHFRHPRTGPFRALVATDKFSWFVSCGVFRGAVTAENTVDLFLSSIQDSYDRVTYDLGTNFRSDLFRSVLERLGTQAWAVPADAHWPSAAEKSIDLLRVELDAVWAECPELSAAGSLAAATHRLNSRATWAHDVTRSSVHLGRKPRAPELRERLVAQIPAWVPTHMDDIDAYMSACDGKRQQHIVATARARVRAALRLRRTPAAPLDLNPGDLFLFWRSAISSAKSGFRGPAICLGTYRALVVGVQGGHLVTAHVSRCILHERTKQDWTTENEILSVLPSSRDRSTEEPLSSVPFDDELQDVQGGSDQFLGILSRDEIADELRIPTPNTPLLSPPTVEALPPVGPEVLEAVLQLPANVEHVTETCETSPLNQPSASKPVHENGLSGTSSVQNPTGQRLPLEHHTFRDVSVADDASHQSVPVEYVDPLPASPETNPLQAAADGSGMDVGQSPASPAAKPLQAAADESGVNVGQLPASPETKPMPAAADESGVVPLTHEGSFVPLLPSLPSDSDFALPTSASQEPPDCLVSIGPNNVPDSEPSDPALNPLALLASDEIPFVISPSDPHTVERMTQKRTLSTPPSPTNPPLNKRHRTLAAKVFCYAPTPHGPVVHPIYLVNQARKRTVIVDVEEGLQMPEMRAAMDCEVESFRRMKCIENVAMKDIPTGANLVTTRWVFTIKTREDGTKRYKARLVARGFEDDEKHRVTKDSPTAASASQRLVLQVLAEKQWVPSSWDFETAFLQGRSIQREVYIAAPPGYVPAQTCWRLTKPVYGLVSAPKAWFDRLREVILAHGFQADLTDEAIFRLSDATGVCIGVLAIHVDDTIGGGTKEFHCLMDAVAEDLKVGSKEQLTFHYKGLRISTVYPAGSKGLFEIVVDGEEYLDSTIPMPLPANRKDEDQLAPTDATLYRSVVGSIGYMASSFRPDLSLETSLLGRTAFHPTVRDARKANAILAWAKANRYNLKYRKGTTCLTGFSDSAGPNENGTQGGRIFAMTDDDCHRVAGWIFWESKKVKRVCRSTATAEVLALGDCHDTAVWLQQLWKELTGQNLPVRLVIDSMGVLKNLVTTALPTEKRLRIDLAKVRQGLRDGEFDATWVPSRANLADPLTKESQHDQDCLSPNNFMKRPLLDALTNNCTNLRGVEKVTKTQADVSKY